MKEIRLHGRGGMGTVKAAEIIVNAKVIAGGYGNSIPFFGFERQGAPVTSFVRLDEKPIRPKTQVYSPDCVIVLDPTLRKAVDVFEGLKDGGCLIINAEPGSTIESLDLVPSVGSVAMVDATGLAIRRLGKPITNTAMLGAFIKGTGWVDLDAVAAKVEEFWGKANADLLREAYDATVVLQLR
ncbi:MAG: pyruvate ferredoxin oxidoreductase [Spirochaetae bacterium HGW-Spirochaetae-7]|jgi:2-oxoacid:acceptor oxidoreductase gamma subunit (pyruvate/2-ketoisovalerate family)|nr:MAG: pyruvate ferredoxin oxidoreductase [Spirochaetae bacterium HGW-Spirochaetae-7]